MTNYKWNNPYEWLMETIESWDKAELKFELLELASHLNFDELQDAFSDIDVAVFKKGMERTYRNFSQANTFC